MSLNIYGVDLGFINRDVLVVWAKVVLLFEVKVGVCMFYISSALQSAHSFGVTDTEDGVEEFLLKAEIVDALEKGIEIMGASGGDLRVVSPYDDVNVAKNTLLRGIEYHLGKHGELKYLCIHDGFDNQPIILGDFCTSVDCVSIIDCVNRDGIPLVFDDRIGYVDASAFLNLRDTFVRCDLTAVRQDILRSQIYRAVMAQGYISHFKIKQSMQDITSDVRDRYFKEACILYKNEYCMLGLNKNEDEWFLKRNKKAMLEGLLKVKKKPYRISKQKYDRIFSCSFASTFFTVNEACAFSFWKTFGLSSYRNYIYSGGNDEDIMWETFSTLKSVLKDAEVVP